MVPKASTVAPGGLVAAYSFDEAGGSEVFDASGNANNGTISGAARVSGRFGNALQFNGNNAWVTIADSDSLDLTDGMTLEAWVRPTTSSDAWETVVLKESASGLAYALYANSDAKRPVGSANTGSDHNLYGAETLPANQWTHLATTYDGTTQRLYVNGIEIANAPQSGDLELSDGNLRIGGNNSWLDEFFTGYIDEVRIYNRAIESHEIAHDMISAIE